MFVKSFYFFCIKINNFFLKRRDNFVAFTLAEVLIVLGIIGIVATLTIVQIINKIQDIEFQVAWKKEYSTFVNATNQIMRENGGNLIQIGLSGWDDTLRDMYDNYVRYIKKCNRNDKYSESVKGTCWHNDGNWYQLNGQLPAMVFPTASSAFSGAFLSDGTMIKFATKASAESCGNSGGGILCGFIIFDINGFKKPNIIGRDIFGVVVNNNGLLPFNNSYGKCSKDSTGWGCSAEFLYDK